MTEWHGAPVEGLSTVGSLPKLAETNAADGFLFTDPGRDDQCSAGPTWSAASQSPSWSAGERLTLDDETFLQSQLAELT
jgi:hypothetical protein